MTWVKRSHFCERPERSEVRVEGAGIGSIWQCNDRNCGRYWSIVELRPLSWIECGPDGGPVEFDV